MATVKQRLAIGKLAENGGNVYRAMIAAGYSHQTAVTPQKLTESKGFQELLDEVLPDSNLINVHQSLLESKAIDHLVFPTDMTDEEITELVESVGGSVRKFKHGDTATHVWFWAANTKARQDALKLAYDLKGKLGKKEEGGSGNIYNTFVQNNSINPNTPNAKTLVDNTIDVLMSQTKRQG